MKSLPQIENDCTLKVLFARIRGTTKDDFKNGQLKKKIDNINEKLSYQYIHVENFRI